ncbi:mitochondrial resolvase Ydc2 [Lophiotrema nucula]|uniref:Mitochondrial resolvase Ydc2 n=1 Tax=Lophiotrema nucula TaxID=690887 RepID=A0A6A5ZGG3_9PLEO|nr:mitochondrial resolvase Ydc2 [Lophiotrema nucula]
MSVVHGFFDAVKATRKGVAKVSTIKSLLTQIGSTTSGNKDVLLKQFSRDLERKQMPHFPENATKSRGTRILSIDMGIKNLAYCVADVTSPSKSRMSKMNVVAWRRLDVEKEISQQAFGSAVRKQDVEGDIEPEVNDPYTPWMLANTAYTLLTNTLLAYNPDVILIERQRWRSAGGPSIQQWTVRVNTLEGMLWAILTALRAEAGTKDLTRDQEKAGRNYEVFGIDPKRVGNFWVGDEIRALVKQKVTSKAGPPGKVDSVATPRKRATQRLSRGKVEKKNKIDLVRTWLTADTPSTALQPSFTEGAQPDNHLHPQFSQATIHFTFKGEAKATRQAICAEIGQNGRRKATSLDTRKLDDVADCFLQASAFVAWEQNKKIIQDALTRVDAMTDEGDLVSGGQKDVSKEKKARKRRTTKE